jgi:hypothetical protein
MICVYMYGTGTVYVSTCMVQEMYDVSTCMVHPDTSDNGYETVAAVLYCATSHKVAGSIRDGVIGIFH